MNSYSLDYIDDLYVKYINDPNSVSDNWRRYFEQFLVASDPSMVAASRRTSSATDPVSAPTNSAEVGDGHASLGGAVTEDSLWLARVQDRIDQLVREYRVRGHLVAALDPLGLARPMCPELNPSSYGLSDADLSRPVEASSLANVTGRTLSDILDKLHNTY